MRKNNAEYEFLSLLGKFITEYLPVSMNASPNTISSYKCAFRLLFQYLDENTEIQTGHITFETLNFNLLTNFVFLFRLDAWMFYSKFLIQQVFAFEFVH